METEKLLNWYDSNKRDLPWRRTSDPYAILLSEIMLQQTRVEAVIEKYQQFLKIVPDFLSLSALSEDALFKLWEGLGYYSRAKNLQKTAQFVVHDYFGKLPCTFEQLLTLPGIGNYTAAAVSSIAFSQPVPAVDGNVLRVFTRYHALSDDIRKADFRNRVFTSLMQDIPTSCPGKFNQAMMELGATVCVPSGKPHCESCPLAHNCLAHTQHHETDFPFRSPLHARKIEQKTVFALKYNGRYFGYKRPSDGLLANLYQLPDCDGELSEEEMLSYLSQYRISITGEIHIYQKKHIFSHVEWHMKVFSANISISSEDSIDSSWILLNPDEHSLPTAFRICLPK